MRITYWVNILFRVEEEYEFTFRDDNTGGFQGKYLGCKIFWKNEWGVEMKWFDMQMHHFILQYLIFSGCVCFKFNYGRKYLRKSTPKISLVASAFKRCTVELVRERRKSHLATTKVCILKNQATFRILVMVLYIKKI